MNAILMLPCVVTSSLVIKAKRLGTFCSWPDQCKAKEGDVSTGLLDAVSMVGVSSFEKYGSEVLSGERDFTGEVLLSGLEKR